MKILEAIDNSRLPLSEALSFTDQTVIDDCIDLVKGRYVLSILDKKELSDDDLELIRHVAKCQGKTEINDDLSTLIVQMAAVARERSKGSAPLARVFVRHTEYDKLIADMELDQSAQVKILGIPLERIDRIIDLELTCFGLCRPKFKNVPLNTLVILGKLQQ